VNELKEALSDVEILNWSLPNEPQYQGATPLDVPYTLMHELVKSSVGLIAVDSSLMHIGQAAKKSGVYLWGNTRVEQFGYKENSNLTFHEGQYMLNDPRNIMVDPRLVVKTFLEKHYAG
jgi:ADP-heptose:LPS heptosyltransferase